MKHSLDEQAREYIRKAMKREKSRNYVSRFYGIPPTIVQSYIEGRDVGPLRAREVIRVEIARLRAVKEENYDFFPTDKDRYKGTR